MLQSSTHQGLPCLEWTKAESTFLAFPTAGARLARWTYDGYPILHWPDPADLSNIAKVRGGNPILFPFAGRSHAEGQPGKWTATDGKVQTMPQHGFVRSGTTRVTEQTDEGFAAEWVPDEIAIAAYPFHYRFGIDYRLDPHRVRVRLQLENLGPEPMPWAPGHHFYFGLPFTRELTRANWRIGHNASSAVRHRDDGGFDPEPANAPLHFDDPAISNRILVGTGIEPLRITSERAPFDLEIRASADAPEHLCTVLWTESEDSPFYCVEPWYGLPNGGGDGTSRPMVEPGKTSTFTVTISILPRSG